MPRVKENVPVVEPNPDFALMSKLLGEYQGLFSLQYKEHGGDDPVRLTRLAVVALTQYAAMLAVDVGMSAGQFSNVCQAQHTEAYNRAPKFG